MAIAEKIEIYAVNLRFDTRINIWVQTQKRKTRKWEVESQVYFNRPIMYNSQKIKIMHYLVDDSQKYIQRMIKSTNVIFKKVQEYFLCEIFDKRSLCRSGFNEYCQIEIGRWG